jgi:hypothetical protein
MRPSRWVSLVGVYRRVLRSYGRVRPEMAQGCPEQLPDREFLSYVWNFEKDQTPKILSVIAEHGPDVPILQLKSHAEVSQLLALLTARH